MTPSRKVAWISLAALLVLLGVMSLWRTGSVDEPAVVVGPEISTDTPAQSRRAQQGLVRGAQVPVVGERERRRLRRRAPQLAEGQVDTADPSRVDTGLTRDIVIEDMLIDVANDTGMNEEGRRRMREALLRTLDGPIALPEDD